MFTCTDQLNRTIELPAFPPGRIVSLVPSQTELLFNLGLDKEVIGITKFCIHPIQWYKNKTRIGGTKNVSIEKVKSLRPGLIIANKEENVKEQIELLEKIAPVWISDVNNLDTAIAMIKAVGSITGKGIKAAEITKNIEHGFSILPTQNSKIKAIYLIWKDPYITVGGDTFINDMLTRCGFQNIFEKEKRYPEISFSRLPTTKNHVVLLSSEPYPFKEKHIAAIEKLFPGTRVLLVDGEMFSWYGSRLQYAPKYFKKLLEYLHTNKT